MPFKVKIVALPFAAIVGLAAMAIAQKDESNESQEKANQQIETVGRPNVSESPSILKKVEDWLSLTDNRLEELGAIAEWLQSEIAKVKTQRLEAKNAVSAPVSPPLLVNLSDETQPPQPPNPPVAEIDNNSSFDSILGDFHGTNNLAVLGGTVLNDRTPDWVKNGLVLGDGHSLAISSNLLPDLELCREDLKSRMLTEVRAYLDKHVLEYADAYKLDELTQDYVEKYWVKKGQEFDNIQDRPSGTYHQLWIGLHLSSEQLSKIRDWEKSSARDQRTKRVGVLGGIGVFVVTLLSGAVGLLARREKAKLKK